MQEFNIGDVVQLKSGGPHMTVQHICDGSGYSNRGDIECIWFDVNGAFTHGAFHPSTVTVKREL